MSVGGRGGVVCADRRLTEAYEGLRRLRHRHGNGDGAGYEVLRRQGLAAWIEAFSGCLSVVAPEPSHRHPPLPLGASLARAAAGAGGGCVPTRLYPELTRLVASLALGRLKEGL